jgi:threonine dehydratase
MIRSAAARLAGVIRRTPLQESAWLSARLGVPVHLKLECWQRTGSFKLRGAYSAISGLDPGTLDRGLVTASAGNHGLAVALSARLHGVRAAVFVPATAPAAKRDRIVDLGGELHLVAGTYDDAAAAARAHARREGARLIHPFNDDAVVAGQGTVGLEVLEALPDVAQVVVPVGGGGLIAGVGRALKAGRGTAVRVVGVQSEQTRAMHDAFAAGRVVPTPVTPTLCDGLAGETETGSFHSARIVTDELHLVPESGVADAIRELYRREGIVAEGAGAVGIAAVLGGRVAPVGPTVIVVSGGNIDMGLLAELLSGET